MIIKTKTVHELATEYKKQKTEHDNRQLEQQIEMKYLKNLDAFNSEIDTLIKDFEHNAFKLSATNEQVAKYIVYHDHIFSSIDARHIDFNESGAHDFQFSYKTHKKFMEWKTALENKFNIQMEFIKRASYRESGSDGGYCVDNLGVEVVFLGL